MFISEISYIVLVVVILFLSLLVIYIPRYFIKGDDDFTSPLLDEKDRLKKLNSKQRKKEIKLQENSKRVKLKSSIADICKTREEDIDNSEIRESDFTVHNRFLPLSHDTVNFDLNLEQHSSYSVKSFEAVNNRTQVGPSYQQNSSAKLTSNKNLQILQPDKSPIKQSFDKDEEKFVVVQKKCKNLKMRRTDEVKLSEQEQLLQKQGSLMICRPFSPIRDAAVSKQDFCDVKMSEVIQKLLLELSVIEVITPDEGKRVSEVLQKKCNYLAGQERNMKQELRQVKDVLTMERNKVFSLQQQLHMERSKSRTFLDKLRSQENEAFISITSLRKENHRVTESLVKYGADLVKLQSLKCLLESELERTARQTKKIERGKVDIGG